MISGLLMLSLLLAAPLAHAAQSSGKTSVAPSTNFTASEMASPVYDAGVLRIPSRTPVVEQQSPEVCYKLRTFLFKNDDDHIPEFLRETTCGPGQPHSHNAIVPGIQTVPAR